MGDGSASPLVSKSDPTERADGAPRPPAQQTVQRIGEVLPHGATHAAVRQCQHFLIRCLDQQMVETHGAKFVDHDGRVGHAWTGQRAAEKGGFAAAQKAGEHGNRQ